MIEGVTVRSLQLHEDDRGALCENIHDYDVRPSALRMAYTVWTRSAGTVRGFHKHHRLIDYFSIINGAAKFLFVDDREDLVNRADLLRHENDACRSAPRPGPGTAFSVVISSRQPKLITVPPGIFHGWVALEPNTILSSFGTEIYDRERPDELRVPPGYFFQEFGKDPWLVEGR